MTTEVAKPGALVIYDNDPDGFGSAWAAWTRLGDNADYIEVGHGTDKIPELAYEYETVYIFDLHFTYEEIRDLREATNVVVIDHHESARPWLEALGYSVDTSRAACVQVWDHFFDTVAPPILQFVADRDIWTWALEHSDEINNVIFLTEKSFEAWYMLNDDLVYDFANVLSQGSAIVEYRQRLVDMILTQHQFNEVEFEGKFYNVPLVHTSVLHSEVGHALLNTYPDAPFVMTYVDEPSGYTKWSMRSEDHRMDVGALAVSKGGGGHRNAAGFRS